MYIPASCVTRIRLAFVGSIQISCVSPPQGSSRKLLPASVDPQKLLSIAARIGVKDAKRFLVKNLRFVTGLAKSGGFYKPTSFVEALAPLVADPAAGVSGLHLYTFNAVEAAEAWRQEMLERLAG